MYFDHIIGHEKIIESFKNAIGNKHIAHSYIFEGPKSIGKKTTASALAKALLGEATDIDNQPDFVLIDSDDNTIKKEQIEELQKDIKVRPFKGEKKVYVICDAEKMTRSAQNSFLKTLEEPPEYATIILTSVNKFKLLPTIVSRCQLITFNYVSSEKIEKLLINKYKITSENAKFISNFSSGIVGRAISLSKDEEFKELRDKTIEAIDTTITGPREKIFTTSEFFEKNKDDIEEILDLMLFYFRDLAVYSEIRNDKYIINKDMMDKIKNHYNKLEKNSLHDIIEIILDTKTNINLKVNFSLNIEIMLLEIQEGVYGSCSRN